jgi:hypothetical protein
MFQDYRCVLLVDFMQEGTTVSVVACCTRLERLRAVIKHNCPFLLRKVLSFCMTLLGHAMPI